MTFPRIVLASIIVASCTYSRTQIMLEIDGDSVVRRDATEVRLHVTTSAGMQSLRFERDAIVASNGGFFPLRIPLATKHAGGSYLLEIEARKVERTGNVTLTTRLASNRIRSVFVAGEVATLPVWLLSGCMCADTERCIPGPGFVPVCTTIDATPDLPRDAGTTRDGARDGSLDGGDIGPPGCEQGFHMCGANCVPDGDVSSCGQRCSACPNVEGGTQVCGAGVCGVRCNGTRQMCGASCIDVQNNQSNCGTCGRVCGNGQICQDGDCVAPPECVESNPASCPVGTYCNQGYCAVGCDQPVDCGANSVCNLGTHECGCVENARRCGGTCALCPTDAGSTTCNAENQCVAASCSAPQILCSGSCTMESVRACGARCEMCTAANGSAACVNGSCTIASCSDGFRLCNGVCAACPSNAVSTTCSGQTCVASACAANMAFCSSQCVTESSNQCGASCATCSVASGSGACVGGSCTVASCDAGYRACNGTCALCPSGAVQTSCSGSVCVATACSSGLALCSSRCVDETANQCGASCASCTTSNGTATCSNGACLAASCNNGYRLCRGACARCPNGATSTTCDGNGSCVANACGPGLAFCGGSCAVESVSQCGASCTTCQVNHGTSACADGSCTIAACDGGYRLCGNTCAACPSNASTTMCNSGNQCIATGCAIGYANCGGQCVLESASQCGAACTTCGATNGTATCSNGNCATTSCNAGYALCAGSCAACPSNASSTTCAGASCVANSCPVGLAFCNGACLTDSSSQCGASCSTCATPHGTPSCTNGSCGVASCDNGYRLCGSGCAACPSNATTTQCDSSNRCIANACISGFANCGGQCVAQSAGQCGASCAVCTAANGTPACSSGSCSVASCNVGYRLCGGQCALCPSNASGTMCSGQACVASSCGSGLAFCSGQCVAESAGQCGSSCATCSVANGTASCSNGTCTVASCNAGYQPSGSNSCQDINECLTANGGCSTNATCSNTPGSRTCACNAGYTGNGLVCTAATGWQTNAFIKASNTGAGDLFGEDEVALSSDGSTLVVGVSGEDSSSTGINPQSNELAIDSGAVYVYVRSGNTWTLQAFIKANNTGASDFFGISVALSADGNTLAVGASGEDTSTSGINPGQNDAGSNTGAVYIFTRSGTTWAQRSFLKAGNAGADDRFGGSIALSAAGTDLVVGASRERSSSTGVNPTPNESAPDSGAAYLFVGSGATWTQQAFLKANNAGSGDLFGLDSSLSADGNTIVIGARYEDTLASGVNPTQNNNGGNVGAAYVFARNGATWTQQAFLKSSNPDSGDWFGEQVVVSGDGNTIGVIAFYEDSSTAGINPQANNLLDGSGALYVFVRSGSNWSQQAFIKASNPSGTAFFGQALSMTANGNALVVGCFGEDTDGAGVNPPQNESGSSSGAAYLFTRTTTTWSESGFFKATNPEDRDYFGYSCAISSNGLWVAVGASEEDSSGTGVNPIPNENASESGAVYLYRTP